MNFSVYILKSNKDDSYYIGVTKNVPRRFKEHNTGTSQSTKHKIPWQLVYQEKFNTIKAAYKRERYIKSRKKRKYIEQLLNNNNTRAHSSAGRAVAS